MVLASREGVTPKGFRPADAVMWRLDRSAAYTPAAPVVSPRQLHQPASARELDRSLRRTMVPSAPLLQSEERTPWPSAFLDWIVQNRRRAGRKTTLLRCGDT